MFGWRGRGALALVLLFVVSTIAIAAAGSTVAPGRTSSSGVFHASATAPVVHVSATDSQYIEFNWTTSQDTCFGSYDLYDSLTGTAGSWSYVGQVTDRNQTNEASFDTYWTGGNALWFYVNDTPCSGPSLQSNILKAVTPYPSPLTITWVNDTGVALTWGNNYTYGGRGQLAFSLYDVYESVNGATWSAVTSFSQITDTSTTISVPSASTIDFYVTTVDSCVYCSVYLAAQSNTVALSSPTPVSDTASGLPTTSEVGVPVAFSCTAVHGAAPFTYTWTFGDGSTGTGANVTHTYTASGSMDAACTVKDHDNSTATSHASVTINPGLAVTATPSATSVAPGSAIVFNATASGGTGGPYTITWNFGDGSTGTGSVATHTYTTAGTYIPTITVTDSLGGTTTKTLSAITVAAPGSGSSGDLALVGGIGAVAVIAAVAVGFLLMQRRKRGPKSPPTAPPPSP